MNDATAATKSAIGRYGVWTTLLRPDGPASAGERAEAAAELEELGFGALWLGGNSSAGHAAPLLAATGRITVGTSIQSVWEHPAPAAAADFAGLEATHPGRFLLGLGVSHGPRVAGYGRPYATMTGHLDALDREGVPAERRVLAALGPRMLELARDRATGAIPYLVTPEHTAEARGILGAGPLLAPELKAVLETDPGRARATARAALARYLELPNYTRNFLRLGFTEDDLDGGGSDRLIDAVFAWGDERAVRERVAVFHAAGADHVAVQLVEEDGAAGLPREGWRRLAAALLG
ncbi:LLM class F420-dependent oxidoreductase [Streptomyces sp. SID8352]|uniref:LLM class F420-dependent oxidoreductase n=1 Tax=Streptomyces sp. SID8352 TaxID=2690338 RepID=UPI00136AD7BF|nr:LLM class F420-dependent oxidoreductase [Streptomyces sp. SID8352]MYU22157.1 TIGR03620 family F420-dependent LLM class oxidoreductase [Streptomyces sp. SID8352]